MSDCIHEWSLEKYEVVESRVCGKCNYYEMEHRLEQLEHSIRNIAAFAKLVKKHDSFISDNILRYCREAGWEDSILR